MASLNQLFQCRDREMRLAYARRPHEQKPFFRCPGIISNEGLGRQLRLLQRLPLLRGRSHIGAVTFKVAMLVALGDPCALDNACRAVLHSAVARHRHLARRPISARHQLPSRTSAKRAILQRHADRIRSHCVYSKVSTLGKLWKALAASPDGVRSAAGITALASAPPARWRAAEP